MGEICKVTQIDAVHPTGTADVSSSRAWTVLRQEGAFKIRAVLN